MHWPVLLVFTGLIACGLPWDFDEDSYNELIEDPMTRGGSLIRDLGDLTNWSSARKPRRSTERDWTPGADCDRNCDGKPQTCYFQFNVEEYVILSPACRNCSSGVRSDCYLPQCIPADGHIKSVLVVNRALPGTSIVVCRNDRVVVDLRNRMSDFSVTIHWHGIRQIGTPFMDGVTMVSQCPIAPADTFRYSYTVNEAGTFFWHSHIGVQKLDGLEGALIVRNTRSEEKQRSLYDEDLTEHVIFVQDWIHVGAHYWTPGPHVPGSRQAPDSVLVNGLGPLFLNGSNDFVPMANFTVEIGKRYRFRLISATCMTCSFAFKIQSHRLTVITGDGGLAIKPTAVDTIAIDSADRFDFILHANQTPGDYYIFVQAIDPFCRGVRQLAVLHYKNGNLHLTEPAPPTGDLGTILNNPFSLCNTSTPSQICVSHLSGESNAPTAVGTNIRYLQVPIEWGVYLYTVDELFAPGTYDHYEEPEYNIFARYTVNNITFAFPPSPFAPQYDEIPSDSLCDSKCYSSGLQHPPCECSSYYSIPLNAVVDMIVYDTEPRAAMFHHPFHLHGNNFYVLEMGVFNNDNLVDRRRQLEQLSAKARNDNVNLLSKAQKDSISTPPGGYLLLRFVADNPGWWILHCHFMYHLESGMATVFKIGNDHQIPKPPRTFPRCGNFLDV